MLAALLTYLAFSLLVAGLLVIFLRGAGRDFHLATANPTPATAGVTVGVARRGRSYAPLKGHRRTANLG